MLSQGLFRLFAASIVSLVSISVSHAAIQAELVSGGFARPLFVCSPPGDSNRLFVVEQYSGQIRIVGRTSGVINSSPFLLITSLRRNGNEEGFLGLAFHPGYQTNGYFFVNTMPGDGSRRTEVNRYRVQGDPATSNTADPASKKLILTFTQPEGNHNGGWLGFGPDGYLYISSGDGGGADDQHGTYGNGQNRSTLLGKILRIDVDNGDPYSIPDGNPFKGHATYSPEIWAFGLRNPWRCSFDRETGNLWIGDVGQGAREEIDSIPAGVGGLNFGWRPREGAIQNPAYPNETPVTTAVNPVFNYPRTSGISVTGGYVYRGSAVPELRGKYIFADYSRARFWATTLDATGTNGTTAEITADLNPDPKRVTAISSFGEDVQGELYICDLDGEIFRITAEGPVAPSISVVQSEGDSFIMSFTAQPNIVYTLESISPLNDNATWSAAQEIPAASTNRTVTLTNSLTGTERYFRIRSQ